MSDEHQRPDIRSLWQSQVDENTSMSLDDIRSEVSKMNRTVRFRTLAEGLACLLLIGGFGPQIFTAQNPIMRVSACLFVIGAGYLLYHMILRRRQARGQLLTEGKPEACAAFYRAELERQRNFNRRVGTWSLLLFCTPAVAFVLQIRRFTTWQFTVTTLVAATFLIVVGGAGNLRRARGYQRELDKLNANSGQ